MKHRGSRYDAHHLRTLAAGACVLLLAGCIAPQQSYVTDVDSRAWIAPATISLPNSDTLSPRRLGIVIRSNEMLRRDTLTLRIAALSPDSVHFEETITLRIPQNPKPASLRREAAIAYRVDVVLSDSGLYRFTFTPTRPVQGIEAIGIHIENNR